MKLDMLVPVILSGGAGTRLWPISREAHPKPFMRLPDGETLLHKTYARALQVGSQHPPVTVTNREYLFASRDTLHEVNAQQPGTFLLEAQGRNTAGAIAVAALHLQQELGNQAIMLVLPADHLVQNSQAFEAAVAQAYALAQQGYLVTFGVKPTQPETGFGYIQAAAPLRGGFVVDQFIEKPPLAQATQFVSSGSHFWNAGMFCMQVGTFLSELAQHAPDVHAACLTCFHQIPNNSAPHTHGIELPQATYGLVPSISIDHALMERSSKVAVVPADMGWSDIGSWAAVSQLTTADAQGNAAVGEALFVNSTHTYVQTQGRMVATVGTHNLVIVDTPDALLVSDAAQVQDVREVVTLLKQQQHPAYQLHQTVARPWGTYTVLNEGPRYKVKRIEVKPGASLSLQMHHHRNEHWIVVSGVAEVTNGEQVLTLQANESTYIPAEHKHRLTNPGTAMLVMIEVQSGSYLGEDDIVRFEDIYGRTQHQTA